MLVSHTRSGRLHGPVVDPEGLLPRPLQRDHVVGQRLVRRRLLRLETARAERQRPAGVPRRRRPARERPRRSRRGRGVPLPPLAALGEAADALLQVDVVQLPAWVIRSVGIGQQ